MKRVLALLLALAMVFALCGCGELTKEKLEKIVFSALQEAIKAKMSVKDNPWNKRINPAKTQYEIFTQEKSGDDYRICGTCTLYDDYGNRVNRWRDNSGNWTVSFEVIVAKDGSVKSTKLM